MQSIEALAKVAPVLINLAETWEATMKRVEKVEARCGEIEALLNKIMSREEERDRQEDNRQRKSKLLEDRERRLNLIFRGVSLEGDVSYEEGVASFIRRELKIKIERGDVFNAHPLYARGPIIARFYSFELRNLVLSAARKERSRERKWSVKEDFSRQTRIDRTVLFPFFLDWKSRSQAVKLRGDAVVGGKYELIHNPRSKRVEEWLIPEGKMVQDYPAEQPPPRRRVESPPRAELCSQPTSLEELISPKTAEIRLDQLSQEFAAAQVWDAELVEGGNRTVSADIGGKKSGAKRQLTISPAATSEEGMARGGKPKKNKGPNYHPMDKFLLPKRDLIGSAASQEPPNNSSNC